MIYLKNKNNKLKIKYFIINKKLEILKSMRKLKILRNN